MAAAQSPSTAVADGSFERGDHRHVAGLHHSVVHLPRLQARADPCGSALVLADAVVRKEFDPLEVVRPYAQCTLPGGLGDEVVARVSGVEIRCQARF